METDQIKLLTALAKELKNKKNTKEEALASLQAANILTKTGRLAKPYRNLGSYFSR